MPEVLNGESIHVLLVEVEAIVNSRSMTTETISDIESDIPLLPANLLTVKSKLVLTPHEYFTSAVESLLFNMQQMNFGRDDTKSSYEHCQNEKRAKAQKETFETNESQNSLELLPPSLHKLNTCKNHGVTSTVRLKFESENKVKQELV